MSRYEMDGDTWRAERSVPDGRTYWVAIEEGTGGKRRYSADCGLTWARTAKKAFAAAERRATQDSRVTGE
mgnify:CR=1 FL=1